MRRFVIFTRLKHPKCRRGGGHEQLHEHRPWDERFACIGYSLGEIQVRSKRSLPPCGTETRLPAFGSPRAVLLNHLRPVGGGKNATAYNPAAVSRQYPAVLRVFSKP